MSAAANQNPTAAANSADPFASMTNSSTAQNSNLLGDLLTPQPQQKPKATPANPKSDSERLVDDMLSQLNVGNNGKSATTTAQQQQQRPNYNSSFFKSSSQTQPAAGGGHTNGRAAGSNGIGGGKANFDDLLGGFKPSSEGQNRTIGT